MLHDKTWFLTLTPLLKNGSRAPDWKYSNDYRLTAPDSKTQLLVRQRHRSLDNSKTNHFICDLRVGQIADCNRKKSQLEQLSNLNYPFAFWANIFEKKCGQSSWFNSVFYHKAQMWMLFFFWKDTVYDRQTKTCQRNLHVERWLPLCDLAFSAGDSRFPDRHADTLKKPNNRRLINNNLINNQINQSSKSGMEIKSDKENTELFRLL